MPSIQDVADQINAKLDAISVSTGTTATNTGNINNQMTALNAKATQIDGRIATMDAHLVAGLTNLGQGLFAILEVQRAALAALNHQISQGDTMICLLEHSNEMLCDIKRKLTTQLALSADIADSLNRIEGIEERVHAEAAGDFDRHAEIQSRMDECCPPDEPPLEPCPDECPKRPYRPKQPGGQDWKPLDPPKPKAGPG